MSNTNFDDDQEGKLNTEQNDNDTINKNSIELDETTCSQNSGTYHSLKKKQIDKKTCRGNYF